MECDQKCDQAKSKALEIHFRKFCGTQETSIYLFKCWEWGVREHTSYLLYGPKWFPPPTRGEAWSRQSNFARLSQLTPSEAYLGLLTPVTFFFCFDKDGWQTSKLSASLGFFFQAMFSEHLNRYFNEPNEFLQELQSRFLLEQLRWLPLKWLILRQ